MVTVAESPGLERGVSGGRLTESGGFSPPAPGRDLDEPSPCPEAKTRAASVQRQVADADAHVVQPSIGQGGGNGEPQAGVNEPERV